MNRLKTSCIAVFATLAMGSQCVSAALLAYPYPDLAPTQDFKTFAKGNLGTLSPSYGGASLIAAWRVLNNRPLSDADIKTIDDAGKADFAWVSNAEYEWEQARNKVLPDFESQHNFNADSPGYRCHIDAFNHATAKLGELTKKYGVKNADVLEWTRGQVAVFANCDNGAAKDIPADVTESAPVWLRHERAYQRAAAALYARDFDQARTLFAQIATDTESPWQPYAAYLVSRSYLEEAETSPAYLGKFLFPQVQTTLDASLEGTGPEQQARAHALERRARFEAAPAAELARIENAISVQDWGDDTLQDIDDYLYEIHLDLYNDRTNSKRGAVIDVVPKGGMTDWLYTVQGAKDAHGNEQGENFAGALAQWRSNPSPAWLIAALMSAKTIHDVPADMLSSATAVSDASPAFAAIQYNLLRLRDAYLIELHKKHPGALALDRALEVDTARLLTKEGRFFPGRDANLLHQLVAEHTTNACTFLRESWMHAAEEGGGAGGDGFPSEFVDDLNRNLSLDNLAQLWACKGAAPEAHAVLTSELWVRAAMLGRQDIVKQVAPDFSAGHPKLRSDVDAYLDADTTNQPYRLARLLLDDQTLTATVDSWGGGWSGVGSLTPWSAMDDKMPPVPGLLFQKSSDVQQAEQDLTQLRDMRNGVSWVGGIVLEHVRHHPFDFSNPGTLADVVTASKYAQATPTSKEAFRLLHHWYRFTGAAHRTKYYY
jgi:hypothetical protein